MIIFLLQFIWRVTEVVITGRSWKPFGGNAARVRIPYPPNKQESQWICGFAGFLLFWKNSSFQSSFSPPYPFFNENLQNFMQCYSDFSRNYWLRRAFYVCPDVCPPSFSIGNSIAFERDVSSNHDIAFAVSCLAEKSRWAYVLAVIEKSLCPSQSWICFIATPLAKRSDAQLCRKSWKGAFWNHYQKGRCQTANPWCIKRCYGTT